MLRCDAVWQSGHATIICTVLRCAVLRLLYCRHQRSTQRRSVSSRSGEERQRTNNFALPFCVIGLYHTTSTQRCAIQVAKWRPEFFRPNCRFHVRGHFYYYPLHSRFALFPSKSTNGDPHSEFRSPNGDPHSEFRSPNGDLNWDQTAELYSRIQCSPS